MKLLDAIKSKINSTKVKETYSNKSNYNEQIDLSKVYCYSIAVPEKEYEISIYAYNEMLALMKAINVMGLIDLPKDVTIKKYPQSVPAKWNNCYLFKNKRCYIQDFDYETSECLNEKF